MPTLNVALPRLDQVGATLDRLTDHLARWLIHLPDHPGTAPALAAAAAATATGLHLAVTAAHRLVGRWRHRRLATDAYLVEITPPPQADPAGGAIFWAHLHGLSRPRWARLRHGTPHVVFEYAFTARTATLRLWVPGVVPPGLIQHAVTAAWPGTTTTTRRHPGPPLPAGLPATGGILRPTRGAAYPLRTEYDTDPLRPLLEAGAATRADEHVLVQLCARPATPRQARILRRAPTRRAAGAPPGTGRHGAAQGVAGLLESAARGVLELADPTRRPHHPGTTGADAWCGSEVRHMLDKTAGPLWETHLRYALTVDPHGRHPDSVVPRLRGRAHTLAAAFAVYAGATNTLRRVRTPRTQDLVAARRFPARGSLLAVDELAALAHLPTDLAVPGLDRAGARPVPAPVTVPAGGRGTKPLGVAQVGGHAIALPVPDARYHLHIPGKTGVGKTTLLMHLVLADVRAGRGAVVIDPGGDLVTDILDRLPADAADRLVLLDPDTGHPPRLNPLATGSDPHLAVDQLVGMFATIFARHWGPRTDDVLRSACLTALQRRRHGQATLEHLVPLLTNKQFRAGIVADLDDPAGLGGFWTWYDELSPGIRAQVIGPVLARMRQFLLRDFVRACVGNPRPDSGPSLRLDHILDHGGLLLCRLPKGQLGDDTARLLGSFVVAQVWQAITRRAAIPEPRRRDASLYIDECHNFLTLLGSVDDMLAEARKYRLSMVLAHQNLTQLPRDLRDALAANARNKILFTLAPDDARIMARHTAPNLTEHDLAHLDAYTTAARLVVDARETPAFTLRTRPPAPALGHARTLREAWIRAATRHRRPRRPDPPH